jgi:mannose-6-phosphate isomerase
MVQEPQLQGGSMLYPYKFKPILVERLWGGRALEKFGKILPPDKLIGETWEISDRDDAQSILANGPDAGQTLRQLIEQYGPDAIIGTHTGGGVGHAARPADKVGRGVPTAPRRFPLLIKLLDARERLSLQVHPPAHMAAQLGGEPKIEMWYILDATPDAHLIAGLKRGVTRETFTRALEQSTIRNPQSAIEPLVHRFPVKPGDTLFVPSGCVHAIDAGLVIAEIQQSSDTTYRVFDWGRPRQLQVRESLASIDFTDFEPSLTPLPIRCDHFQVEKLNLTGPTPGHCDGTTFHILGCVAGEVTVNDVNLRPGEFALLPAVLGHYTLVPQTINTAILKVTA